MSPQEGPKHIKGKLLTGVIPQKSLFVHFITKFLQENTVTGNNVTTLLIKVNNTFISEHKLMMMIWRVTTW
jgi:hypothetical protein